MHYLTGARIIGAATFAAAAFLFIHTFADDYQTSMLTAGRGPVFFPRIILGFVLLFSFLVCLGKSTETKAAQAGTKQATHNTTGTVLAVLILTGGYIFGITAVGFLIATILFTFAAPWLLGYRNIPVMAAVTIIYPPAVWYLFEQVFQIILPSSPWFEAF